MINDIYDIYNQLQAADEPTVLLIIGDIKTEVAAKMVEEKNTFQYDTEPRVTDMDIVKVKRIIDRVIAELRFVGIRVHIEGQTRNSIVTALPVKLNIAWNSRSNREYLKTYC